MARTLLCEIVTPERILYHNEAQMVVAPAADGEIGILPLHAPLVALLKPGEIRVRLDDNEVDWIATSGGYLQVHEDKVIVLADRAELASRIDVGRAREAMEAIQSRIRDLPEKDEAALDELKWYEVQIAVGSKAK
ncbi:MAG TPA: ATP synthase F1 subunit epsilon [Coriobacteriia bacterium]|jgi:F-type H+-transporting ATPase subunit epsilon